MQIGESAGAECKAALQESIRLIEQKLATDGKALKAVFNAADVCWFLSYTLKTRVTFTTRFSNMVLMLYVDLFLVLQLEIDGDFLYFLADAAVTAVTDMTPAVSFLIHCNS